MTLGVLNSLNVAEASSVFRSCCGASRWVESMVNRRPYNSRDDVFAAADSAWSECGPEDYQEAFSHHPRIGAKVTGKEAAEQAGAQSAFPASNFPEMLPISHDSSITLPGAFPLK